MSGFETGIQKAIYDALIADSLLQNIVYNRIYDDVPQTTDYPYVTLGEDISTDESTDDGIRRISSVVIHIWSRFRGREEVKSIQDRIERILNRAELTIADYEFVGIHIEQTDSFLDQDGLTRHGTMSFRTIIKRD